MSAIYDRQGRQITNDEWAVLLREPDASRVALDVITIGEREFTVSTIWLGLDHGYDGKLAIFETMVFADGSWSDLYCDRYATEEDARAGHQEAVDLTKAGYFLDAADKQKGTNE